MKTFLTAARGELARITATRLSAISLLALMCIPLVYGGLYLWGNRDPYAALDRVPAALVVADSGATVDGKSVDYGRDAADAVRDSGTFGWSEVSQRRAQAGVKDGTYDFALVFPADFSKDLASASTASPATARLGLITDDTNSYLSTTIAKQAADRVAAQVAAKLGRTASLTLLDGVAQLRKGLTDAADGASSLAGGATSADAGAASLASGTAQLESGAAALDTGLGTLRASTAQLPAQSAELAAGAQQLRSGIGQVHALAGSTQADVASALAASDIPPAEQARILGELGALGSATGPGSTLGQGASALAAGTSRLSASAPALRDGIARAADGASALRRGSASAAGGAAQLHDGTFRLASGSDQLRDGLRKGVAEAPATTAAERATIATALAHPLDVKQTSYASAGDYGAGLAPFFMSLAAWIGIYALFLLVRPLSRRALTSTRRPIATALAGWAVPAALGVVQMAALFALVTLGLHLPVANALGLMGFLALVSASYAAIVLALNVWLGSVGQFLGLLLMVVQLVTAGGTFPWQTLPGPLAVLHRALPMSHAVDGIRALMYGGSGAAGAIGILLVWLVAGLAIAVAGAAKQSGYRTLRELRPSAIGG